ncbi:MAG: hypothetical protein A2W17_08200 [Planctomycetes bacterium RBG_16_41_13]|nr:MAG: hypothetical protein A2W17_08200 [Planctomycetes bacterium RBG_16_41_13]
MVEVGQIELILVLLQNKITPMEHMGHSLRELLKQKKISADELGKRIGRSGKTVQKMFLRPYLHSLLLEKISKAIEHDMFQYMAKDIKPAHERIAELEEEVRRLKAEITLLKERQK